MIMKIKNMLYEQNFTIAGAKKKIREDDSQNRIHTRVNDLLHDLLSELNSIRKLTE